MDRNQNGEELLAQALESTRNAAHGLKMTIERIAGSGDGTSWLDQLADEGQVLANPPWDVEQHKAASDLLEVAKERLRFTRAATGELTRGEQGRNASATASSGYDQRLPLNRKERYYTGTVLPMLIASDGFAHLHRFLELCGLPEVRVGAHASLDGGSPIQFFTEYSFAESVISEDDKARFPDRPFDRDTPDIVITGHDWLLAVEAKMFHRPSREALEGQMARQRTIVDYWSRAIGMPQDRVGHVLLLPKGLADDRTPLGSPVVTWEQVHDAFAPVAPAHWTAVLRVALDRYSALASPEPTFRTNADALVPGGAILAGAAERGYPYVWMGRSGGLNGGLLASDLATGAWRERAYEVRVEPLIGNRNWFSIRDFVATLHGEGQADAAPVTDHLRGPVSLHAENGLYVEASLDANDSLVIRGQDLSGSMGRDEYEYALTVLPDAFPNLVAQLGGQPGDDVLDLLYASRGELLSTGEAHWFAEHRIPAELWSRFEPGD